MFLRKILEFLLPVNRATLPEIADFMGMDEELTIRGLKVVLGHLRGFGEYREAERVFVRKNQSPPRIHDALLAEIAHQLGRTWMDCGEYQVAEEHFRYAVGVDPERPKSARYHHRLGQITLNRGDLDEARQQLVSALELDAGRAGSWRDLGFVYHRKQDFGRAIGCFLQAVDYNSDLEAAWFGLGVTRYRMGDVDGALRALKHALRLNPDCEDAKSYIEKIEKARGEELSPVTS